MATHTTALQFVGKDAVCYVHEVSEVSAKDKTMTMRSRNITYSHLLQVEEVCHYEADPTASDGDVYVLSCFFSV